MRSLRHKQRSFLILLLSRENIHGLPARLGKVVAFAMCYNNGGVAVTTKTEQQKVVRNPTVMAKYAASRCSYPRRNPNYKGERA